MLTLLVRERNPRYAGVLGDFNEKWKRKTLERHFSWCPAAEQPDNDYLRDGVHTTVDGQRNRTLMLLPTFLQASRDHELA